MHRIVTTQVGAGQSAPVRIDCDLVPVNIGFGCAVTGTVTYTMEHCFDDPFTPQAGWTWYPHPFVVAQTSSKDGNYAAPITAYRINIASGTGTVVCTSIQGNHP